jgi:hypothetical protein
MNWAGALVSFLLIVGLAAWGYQLLKRDVTGVPVVRALEGPMRVAPEDPGGVQADYQGLSVTQVSSDGAFEAPIERVTLAPPPVRMADEDRPAEAITPRPVITPAPDSALDTVLAEVAPSDPAPVRPADPVELALAEALGTTTDAAQPGSVFLLSEGNAPRDAARVKVIPASIAGVVTSPRPIARPANLVNAALTTPAATQSDGPEVAASAIPAGTRLVQLGAFPDAESARAAWGALEAEFGDFLKDRRRVIQEATAGGSTFYRLRAVGFEGLSDARQFCAVLTAQNANCIPVVKR